MTSKQPQQQPKEQNVNYPTGKPAIRLDEFECGFCYYLSGRVAACITKVNSYQKKFQFFADNNKKAVLGAIDEFAVGSIGRKGGKKMILTKESGMIVDGNEIITKAWNWDPKTQNAGTPPTDAVVIELNDSLTFTYRDRSNITMKFAPCPGIAVTFSCGLTLRRTDTYFDHARREVSGPQRGKLIIDQEVPTLKERQKQIEIESIEKRSKQKPRSKDLTLESIKKVVATLETKFDNYEGCKVSAGPDAGWKEKAHVQSLNEIPVLPKTGFEVGTEPSFYGQPLQQNDASKTLARLKNNENGEWLEAVEIRHRLMKENPLLKRSVCLTNASGRYSRDIAVPGRSASFHGEHLELISSEKLDHFLKERCEKDQLVIVACLRRDDQQSRRIEMLLEQIKASIEDCKKQVADGGSNNNSTSTSYMAIASKCRLVKCELTESRALSERYQIHAAPTFLIFYDSKLVNVSSLGGIPVRATPATRNAHLSHQTDHLPRILLVEKDVKNQLATEKTLKKELVQWDLAISGEQAAAHCTALPISNSLTAHSQSSSSSPYGIFMLSDSLDEFEIRTIDRFTKSKEKKPSSDSVVCALVCKPLVEVHFAGSMCLECRKAHGKRVSDASANPSTPMACPHCGIISCEDKTQIVSATLANSADILIYKHVKSATLHRVLEKWCMKKSVSHAVPSPSKKMVQPSEESHKGLTMEFFFKEMEKNLSNARRGIFLPDHFKAGVALSANDTILGSVNKVQ